MHRFMALLGIAVSLALGVAYAQGGDPHADAFKVAFGIFGLGEQGEVVITEETRRIPLRYRQDGFRFGVIIYPASDSAYRVQLVHKLPSTDPGGSSRPRIIKAKPVEMSGISSAPFGFDPGDPEGEYEVSVVINAELREAIRYTVYRPAE